MITAFIMREIHAKEEVMDHRRPIIRTIADAEGIRAQMLAGAARTADWLRSFTGDPMEMLKAQRFKSVGHDPLTGEPLNVVEQLNQTFTILVTLSAVERLIRARQCFGHPQVARQLHETKMVRSAGNVPRDRFDCGK